MYNRSHVTASLLATKLYMPQRRLSAVPRARLTARLLEGLQRPGAFALLSAPAGFGKTTLLSELLAQVTGQCAWLSLDEGDNDPVRFWSYVIAAVRTAEPEAGEAALALLQAAQPVPDELLPTLLINDLAALDHRLLLVLDDYHLIHNASIHAALGFLLDHLPGQLSLVISTRVDPPWPLAHFRVRGQLVELRALDLRFTAGEAAAFLNGAMHLGLSAVDVAALEARTEGWIASLQLAALSLQGRGESAAFIRAFTGSQAYVAEYLVEEVLQRQPDDVRDFLLRTSVLQSMNAALCEAVSGQADGRSRLRQVLQANLFLVPLDEAGEWYRYHQLFADLLRVRLRESLPPGEVAALRQRAIRWFEQEHMLPEAIEQALAVPDYPGAVRLVEQAALPMILQAHVRTVEQWLQAIPAAQRSNSPRLEMAFAWLYVLRAAPDQAQPYLERLERFFAGQAGESDPALLAEWLAIQSKLEAMRGRPAESRALAERALRILPDSALHVRSLLHLSLAQACEQLLDYDQAAAAYQSIVREAQASGNYVAEILATSAHARMLLLQGRLRLACEVAAQGVQRMESTGRSTPFGATLYGELGQVHYQWHRLDEARRYLGRSAQASGLSGYSDSEIYQHIMLARIHQMAGDWHAAEGEMEQAAALARRVPPALVRDQLIAQQVRVDLALGRSEAAEAALQSEGFGFIPAFKYPPLSAGPGASAPAPLLYNCALRAVLQRAGPATRTEAQRAIELAGALLDEELRCTEIPAALETLLLRSQLRRSLGDEQGSHDDVLRALALAEPEGFMSAFVEEGPPVARALESLGARAGAHAGFVARLLECFPAERRTAAAARPPTAADPSRALIEPLTRRELEVLGLIAAGEPNQAIADRLVITLSAVKKHTGNIFRKLGVNSRTQAALRARELGLLPAGE